MARPVSAAALAHLATSEYLSLVQVTLQSTLVLMHLEIRTCQSLYQVESRMSFAKYRRPQNNAQNRMLRVSIIHMILTALRSIPKYGACILT